MDVLNHGLWGALIAYSAYPKDKKHVISGLAIGMLPDVLAFAPMFFWLFFSGQRFSPSYFQNTESAPWVFSYAVNSYNFTHSLVVCLVVLTAVYLIRKRKFYIPLLAWPLHIMLDIPTHPDFFSTPFLYPLSNYTFKGGVTWANPWIFATTYSALILVFLYIRFRKSKLKNV
jgi:membrane-bound metal-dependent hydrolase YbcI (DUF457 family)